MGCGVLTLVADVEFETACIKEAETGYIFNPNKTEDFVLKLKLISKLSVKEKQKYKEMPENGYVNKDHGKKLQGFMKDAILNFRSNNTISVCIPTFNRLESLKIVFMVFLTRPYRLTRSYV